MFVNVTVNLLLFPIILLNILSIDVLNNIFLFIYVTFYVVESTPNNITYKYLIFYVSLIIYCPRIKYCPLGNLSSILFSIIIFAI